MEFAFVFSEADLFVGSFVLGVQTSEVVDCPSV